MNYHIMRNPELAATCLSKQEYFRRYLTNTDYVLCIISAAEYLGLCNWTTDPTVYVWTKQECAEHSIKMESHDGLYCTTINQTINDRLADETIDEQVIQESLAELYYKNNYADLTIRPENQAAFEHYRVWAEEYYIQV